MLSKLKSHNADESGIYFAFVSRYKEQEDAEEAQAAMDGCEFNGKNISVTFAQSDRKSKDTMANGTYAMNMEIEMLKKELAKEADRLKRIERGEAVTPPKEDRRRSRSRSRDRRRDHRGRRSRSRDRHRHHHDRDRRDRRSPPHRGPPRAPRPRDDTDDCPEFRMKPRSSKSRSPERKEDDRRDRRDDRRSRDHKSHHRDDRRDDRGRRDDRRDDRDRRDSRR